MDRLQEETPPDLGVQASPIQDHSNFYPDIVALGSTHQSTWLSIGNWAHKQAQKNGKKDADRYRQLETQTEYKIRQVNKRYMEENVSEGFRSTPRVQGVHQKQGSFPFEGQRRVSWKVTVLARWKSWTTSSELSSLRRTPPTSLAKARAFPRHAKHLSKWYKLLQNLCLKIIMKRQLDQTPPAPQPSYWRQQQTSSSQCWRGSSSSLWILVSYPQIGKRPTSCWSSNSKRGTTISPPTTAQYP